MRVQCPACGQSVDASATECPVCLRKRTKQEIFAGLRGEEPPSRRPEGTSWSRVFLWGVPGAMLIAYAVMTRGAAPDPAAAPAPSSAEPMTPSRADLAAAPPAPAAASAEPEAPSGPAPDAPRAAPPAARPKPPDHWTLKGGVYDLLSAKPVAGVEVDLRSTSSGEEKRARTDAKGLFSVRMPLPDDGPYRVALHARGFRAEFLDDAEPSYLVRGAVERREAAGQLDSAQVLHVPITAPEGADSASYNFLLVPAPRRGRGAAP